MNIKQLVAREGLILLGVSIGAFIVSQNTSFQDWIVSTKVANPNLPAQVLREQYGMVELGDIILRRAQIIGFLLVLGGYLFIRFIAWAIRMLKLRGEK